MKKINFISNLIKEEKIFLRDINTNLIKSYNIKSSTSLKAAKILLSQNLLEESTSLAYYSMYHKTTSLFNIIGLKCENHSATIILLKELFEIDNSSISFAKEERIDKQYYSDFIINKKDVKELIENTEIFISKVDFYIDSLTEEKRNFLLTNFKKLYF